MNPYRALTIPLLLLWLLMLSPGSPAHVAAAPTYTITDLGNLPGLEVITPAGINDAGQVVGRAEHPTQGTNRDGFWHGFLWQNGAMTDLGTLGGKNSDATAINNTGQIVGVAENTVGTFHGFLWQNGTMRDLTPDSGNSSATAINATGQIVGDVQKGVGGAFYPYRHQNGATTIIEDKKLLNAFARSINNAGDIAGSIPAIAETSRAVGVGHALLYSNGAARDLGTLPGAAERDSSAASDLNNRGQVVGEGTTNYGVRQSAFLWQNGQMIDLSPGGARSSATANAINDAGQIVGEAEGAAVLWQDGTMLDLNTVVPADSGWKLLRAHDINNQGRIVGWGTFGGKFRGFLLTPAQTPTLPPSPVGADLCFPGVTPFCVAGAFRAQWEGHGGLAINGYPLSDVFTQRLEDGQEYDVQYFERVRMELHRDAQGQPLVLLGQFGRRLHPADPPVAPTPGTTAYPTAPGPGGSHFPATQHNVSGGFLSYWQANGALAQFGFPLSEVFTETLEDGNAYPVQYFERARFEYHGSEMLLGQFGRRILAETPR